MNTAEQHDIVVIGTSAGGVTALPRLVARLPADLPAAAFVVQHISPASPAMLAPIRARAGPRAELDAADPSDVSEEEGGDIRRRRADGATR